MNDFRGIDAKPRRAGGKIDALTSEMDELRSEIVQGVEEGCCHGNWLVSAAGGE